MTQYVTGSTIKALREKKGYTQKQLAGRLALSDKTVSKWERQKGLPDICLIEPLAKELGVSMAELLSGEYRVNKNTCANMQKSVFYVCPVCGNVIHSTGEGSFCCCGISLPALEAEEADEDHCILAERSEADYFVTIAHPMQKDHYLSFIAYVTADRIQLLKLYPEQNPQGRFRIAGPGILYAYCNRHGLYKKKI